MEVFARRVESQPQELCVLLNRSDRVPLNTNDLGLAANDVVPQRVVAGGRIQRDGIDASAAAHLFTLAIATGGEVTVNALQNALGQPDRSILNVFEAFGARVSFGADGSVTVAGPGQLRPVDTDLSQMPDQLPNVAVLAALARGTSRIRGVGVTRFHETDRMDAVAKELVRAGVDAEVGNDDVVVRGGAAKGGVAFRSYHDHRMAMALAALAAAVGDAQVTGANCVSKTYRAFWSDAAKLGLNMRPMPSDTS